MKISYSIVSLVLAFLITGSSVASTIKSYTTMSNPTIDLTSATKVVEENILNFTRGLKHRDRVKLVEKITDELKAAATVRARNEKGHFIADDPTTPKDESVAPAFPKEAPAPVAISPEPDPVQPEPEVTGKQEGIDPEKEVDPEEKQPELDPEKQIDPEKQQEELEPEPVSNKKGKGKAKK